MGLLLLVPGVVLAQGAPGTFDPGLQKTIADLTSYVITALNVGTWMIFVLLSQLIDPRVIFDLGNAGEEGALLVILNSIWQLSRDLMNVVFALILIGAAIYTIVKANKQFLAEYAPKFILAVIAVNFSWFVPRLILDVANVATATVYGVPELIANNQCTVQSSSDEVAGVACQLIDNTDPDNPIYNCPCTYIRNAAIFVDDDEKRRLNLQDGVNGWESIMGDFIWIQKGILTPNAVSGQSTVLNGLIVNHARLQYLGKVPRPLADGEEITQMFVFILRQLIMLVIHIALFFPLAALLVAFLIRIPILWVTMAFMPFYFLSLIPGLERFGENLDTKKLLFENFLRAAFLPTMVAVPMVVGYIMLNAAMQVPANPLNQVQIPLIDEVNNFYQLLWLFTALAIMWMGVFAALRSNEFVGKFTEGIRSVGEGFGKVAVKAPLAVPLPGAGGRTPLQLSRQFSPGSLNALLNAGLTKDNLRKWRGGEVDPRMDKRRDFATNIRGNEAQLKQIRDALAKGDDVTREEFDRMIKALKENGLTHINRINIVDELRKVEEEHKLGFEINPTILKENADKYKKSFDEDEKKDEESKEEETGTETPEEETPSP